MLVAYASNHTLLPIDDAIAEYTRMREELIFIDKTRIYRLYGLNVASQIVPRTGYT